MIGKAVAEEKQNFPQIPNRVWWGVRKIIQSRPKAKLTDHVLATQLSVQPSAAKAYLKQFQIIGLLEEDGTATALANKWRNDPSYTEAITQILEDTYPKDLVDGYPVGEADVQKVSEWFQYGGLGSGSARNKAATYVLIANGNPDDAEGVPSARQKTAGARQYEGTSKTNAKTKTQKIKQNKSANRENDHVPDQSFPLNLNIQIHISADASKDQIETIFSAMNKYLR